MALLYKTMAKAMLICIVLFIAFMISTIAFDTLARARGFYDEGLRNSNELKLNP